MKYFIYRHIRLDTNEVFYIGLGKKLDNFATHKSEYRRAYSKRRNKHWVNITNITSYVIEVIFESDDFEIIKNKEKEFIKLYGRKDKNEGTLVNYTDGGEGTKGYIFTKEQLIKLSDSHKGIPNNIKGKSYEDFYGERAEKIKLRQSIVKKGKYSNDKNPFYNKKHSETTKIKMGTKILQYDLEYNFIKKFDSITIASKETNSTISLIQKVCKGERKKHNGFIWRYEDMSKTRML